MTVRTPVEAPSRGLTVTETVDWLELTALFNEFGIARLDALSGSLATLSPEIEDDIGERDKALDQWIESVENEVADRQRLLGDAYPFNLGEDADEVSLVSNWFDEQFSFYLVCLVTSHVTDSAILKAPPSGDLLTRLRNRIFQILATLAMAGLANGSAVSVGWPRQRGGAVVEVLQRALDRGASFGIRQPVGPYTPPREKDGGIDVIAWSGELTPPPVHFYFAQAASGNNWREKPVSNHAEVFKNNYMQDLLGNIGHATIIPFCVADRTEYNQQSLYHKAIIDRKRLPLYALAGLQRAQTGVAIDEADQLSSVTQWIAEYREFAVSSA